MKLNWGHYIVITIALFLGLIGYMVVRSFSHNNDLVAEDYYAQEIEFQDVIDKKKNASELEQDITWKSEEGGIAIYYPGLDEIEGSISLMRPSNKIYDLELAVEPDTNGRQFIPGEDLIKGKYLVRIDWRSGSQKYFTEGSVFVNR